MTRSVRTRWARVVVLGTAAITLSAGSVGAAGGSGSSFCSNSGRPTGEMPELYGSPGEFISWVARNVGHGQDNHPGPIVAEFCNPNRAG